MSRQDLAIRLALLLFIATGLAGLALLASGMPIQWHYVVTPLPSFPSLAR